MPTKATLFGLDVRFRYIDQKIAEEKAARAKFRGRRNKSLTRDENGIIKNRHTIPHEILGQVDPKF